MPNKIKYSLGDPTKNSCKGCKKRKVGCHSKCEKYKRFREELDKEVNEQRSKRVISIGYFIPRKRGRK